MSIKSINLESLQVSPQNVRKSFSKSGIDEMKASIISHGLLDNLIVSEADDGMYNVVGGGRRLVAMQALQKEGSLPKGYVVPCKIVNAEDAAELSLAENTVREAMHPADEFEAFAALAVTLPPSEIALRFGVTPTHVLRRLKLGRVAPDIMEAFRKDKLDLESMMAFTLTDDHAVQRKVFKATKGSNAYSIRRLLTDAKVGSEDKLARFVGLAAYQAAGGKVTGDLFNAEQFLDDPTLLQELAEAKLKSIEEQLKSEGWGWVATALEDEYGFTHKYGRINSTPIEPPKDAAKKHAKLAKECEKLESQLQDMSGDDPLYKELDVKSGKVLAEMEILEGQLTACEYDPEEMKTAGCFVRVGYEGNLKIDRGLVTKKDQQKLEETKTGVKAKPEEKGFSQALIDSLKQYRLQIARAELASNPQIAFDLLVFKAAHGTLSNTYIYSGPDVSFSSNHFRDDIVQDAKNTPAGKLLREIKEKLNLSWLKEKTEEGKFTSFTEIPQADKLAILAYCTAATLKTQLAEKNAYETALGLTEADVAEYWRPTAENYLSKVTRDQLLAIGAEFFGKKWAVNGGSMKKGQLVTELHNIFAKPESTNCDKETVANINAWLPEGMAFAAPEKKPAKTKKKAA